MPDASESPPPEPRPAPNSARVQGLYQDLLLAHYRRPRNRGTMEHPDAVGTVANPLCGDAITVALQVDTDGRVRDARFTGQGCSIAQASASMLTEHAIGAMPDDLRRLRQRVDQLLAGDADVVQDTTLGDLHALAGVAGFPARFRCATLPWEALELALRQAPHG